MSACFKLDECVGLHSHSVVVAVVVRHHCSLVGCVYIGSLQTLPISFNTITHLWSHAGQPGERPSSIRRCTLSAVLKTESA